MYSPIRNRKVFTLITFGVFVHTLILKAAFDIYFSSPIDHGMTPIKSTKNPPAKRLVFIVADGLRVEAILDENEHVAPNLNRIRKTRSSWGVSHTRVPTESRPGHVALLGGIYEDPAAILKGWKVNPVDFDSVINQSTNAFCWGGPSIVNMFNKDNLPHIKLHSYDHSMEDFGNNNTIGLDSWVFERVKAFIDENKDCKSKKCGKFRQNGNLFFLHLLGTDTAGHAFKPESEGYKNNIRFVDANIPKVEEWFENAFPDKSTVYIFTADHGMTNWGSHGAGSNHETETPLIAWGAGIKVEGERKDVNQIDIAPLMSALIGINYPINSLGRLPSDYIEAPGETLAEMMISNVLQLMETFNIKRIRTMKNALRFVPYAGVTTSDLEGAINVLKNISSEGQYDLLKTEVESLVQFLIDGADYYHNYYQLPLLIAITIGLVAWIIYLATFNIYFKRSLHGTRHVNYIKNIQFYIFGPVYLNAWFVVKLQSLPFMYYCYFMFPIVMAQIVAGRYCHVLEALRQMKNFGLKNSLNHVVFYMVGLGLLVHGFLRRESLSVVEYLMAAFVFWSDSLNTHTTKYLKVVWVLCCVATSLFPFLPVMKTTFNTSIYLFGYVMWWVMFHNFILYRVERDASNRFIAYQFIMFKLTPIYTLSVEYNLVGPESYLKYAALIWALFPIGLVPFTSSRIFSRLTSIFVGFGTYYLMVSSTYENLFLICYITQLYAWLKIESKCFGYATLIKKSFNREVREDRDQTSDDFRRAFFFVALIFLGFFGTGNIASLNSFDPMWVRCFLTVFSPFTMTGLILLKIIVPFVYASCVYRAVNLFRKGSTLSMFCIVLMFSDLMLLELLYCITNIGSWLEIGTSLSQFVIMEAFVIILLLLYGIGYLLTTLAY